VKHTLRAAIVGPGRIASTYDDEVPVHREAAFFAGANRHPGLYTVHPINHAEAYRTTEGYDLVAVAGRGSERLAAFRQRWGVPGYTDLTRMLDEQQPDVVSVCTQSADKAAVTCAIAAHGGSVRVIIVEKAMATSVAETDRMIAACEAAGIDLVVNHPYRFSAQVRDAKRTIEAGEIGPLGTVAGWSGGGAIHGGTHVFDLLRYVGGDIAEVIATGPEQAEWKDGPASGTLRFASGVIGFFSLERAAMAGFDFRGANGQLIVSTIVGESWIARTSLLDPASTRKYPQVAQREPFHPDPPERSTTQHLLLDVQERLWQGTPVISSGRDGAAALEAGIAALISARGKRPVSLPLTSEEREIVIPNR
jgi:predicted dehydrogenase